MNCKICDSRNTHPLFPKAEGGPWHRCFECGSDSSELTYDPAWYEHFVAFYRGLVQTFEKSKTEMTNNANLFDEYRRHAPCLDFLDVGHCDGAAMSVMQDRGWRVHGWDVRPESDFGPCTTIAPEFRAALFPRQYGAVLCREVIEHSPDWQSLLAEIVQAALPGALIQIQTPRPWWEGKPLVYHREHLQIFSVPALQAATRERGLTVLAEQQWPMGQLLLCQKSNSTGPVR